MQLFVKAHSFGVAVGLLQPVTRGPEHPPLDHVLVEGRGTGLALFTASRGDMTLRLHLYADVKAEGQVLVPLNQLVFVAKQMSGSGHIQIRTLAGARKIQYDTKSQVVVHYDSSNTHRQGKLASEYPALPEPVYGENPVTASPTSLYKMLRLGAYASDDDLGMSHLLNVRLSLIDPNEDGNLRMNLDATNGARVSRKAVAAVCERPLETEFGRPWERPAFIYRGHMPALATVVGQGTGSPKVDLGRERGWLHIRCRNRLPDRGYAIADISVATPIPPHWPDIEPLFARPFSAKMEAVLNRRELAGALATVAEFNKGDEDQRMSVTMAHEHIVLQADRPGEMEGDIERLHQMVATKRFLTSSPDPKQQRVTFDVNVRYLAEAVANTYADEVRIGYRSREEQIAVLGEEPTFEETALIMPLRPGSGGAVDS